MAAGAQPAAAAASRHAAASGHTAGDALGDGDGSTGDCVAASTPAEPTASGGGSAVRTGVIIGGSVAGGGTCKCTCTGCGGAAPPRGDV